jgi:hypothetical protein
MTFALTFAFQFITPILAGLLVSRYLHHVLRQLLIDLCGTAERAAFWVRVTAVLLVAMPLLLVMLTSGTPSACSGSEAACAIDVLRRTCVFTLVGVLSAVLAVASIARRYIPGEASAKGRAA